MPTPSAEVARLRDVVRQIDRVIATPGAEHPEASFRFELGHHGMFNFSRADVASFRSSLVSEIARRERMGPS